jgi:hypothetical protein
MSEFHDPDLENMLGRASGAYPDANAAYAAVSGRVRQVRRRRAMAASTVACAVVVVAAVLAAQGPRHGGLQPGGSSNPGPDVTTTRSVPGTSDVTNPSEPTTPGTIETATGVPTTVASSGTPGGPTGSVGSQPPSTATGGSSGHGGTGSGSSPGGPPSTGATTSTAPPSTTKYGSIGGSITVRSAGGTLTVISIDPAAGFTQDSGATLTGDRVEVQFTNGTHTSRIRVELAGGVPQPRIDEHG